MPNRPANISGVQDILPTVNQLIRELQIRVDKVQQQVPQHTTQLVTSTLNFGAIGANTAVERPARVSSANAKSAVSASPQLTLGNTHLIWSAYPQGNGVVIVRLLNPTAGSITPNTVIWNISVTG